MHYTEFESRQSQEVIELFTRVFSDSEGEDEGILVGNLVSELITADTRLRQGFVATDHKKIVACIFFSRLKFKTNIKASILSPVAVDTGYQGKGIGQQLITFGLQQLKEQGVELVFTYGDPNFYQKVDFIPISEECIKAPVKLTYPEGWLGQSLRGNPIKPIAGRARCVEALNKPEYW